LSNVYSSVPECAKAYNINPNTLHGWIHKYNKQSKPKDVFNQAEELLKLKRELARAKMENDILKKAAIYFANQAQ